MCSSAAGLRRIMGIESRSLMTGRGKEAVDEFQKIIEHRGVS